MPISENPDEGKVCEHWELESKVAKHMDYPKERSDAPDYFFNELELSSHGANLRHTILDHNAASLVAQAENEASILGMHKALASNPLVFLHNQ